MPERTYRALLWVLALTGLALDQSSKYGVFAWLAEKPEHEFALFRNEQGGFVLVAQFQRDDGGGEVRDADGARIPHVNQGALFGFLRDHKALANGGFALISLLAAAAIIFWSTHKNTARDRWLCAALGLILAGTLGNFYDRVVFNGVRDFLHFHYLFDWPSLGVYYPFDWPVFNIADCCLVCGAFLLLVQAFVSQPKVGDKKVESPTQQATAALSRASSFSAAPKA
jgi:lipoprotein signal peptidase